jgi:hypothetical protein
MKRIFCNSVFDLKTLIGFNVKLVPGKGISRLDPPQTLNRLNLIVGLK